MSDGLKTFFGYCLAVTAATLPFVMLKMLPDVSHFESGTSNLIGTKIQHFIEMAIFTEFVAWLSVFIFAALPFLIGLKIVGQYESDGCTFYVTGGIITAMLIGPLTFFVRQGFNDGVAPPESEYLGGMPFFAPFGALAGFTFWRFAKYKNSAR